MANAFTDSDAARIIFESLLNSGSTLDAAPSFIESAMHDLKKTSMPPEYHEILARTMFTAAFLTEFPGTRVIIRQYKPESKPFIEGCERAVELMWPDLTNATYGLDLLYIRQLMPKAIHPIVSNIDRAQFEKLEQNGRELRTYLDQNLPSKIVLYAADEYRFDRSHEYFSLFPKKDSAPFFFIDGLVQYYERVVGRLYSVCDKLAKPPYSDLPAIRQSLIDLPINLEDNHASQVAKLIQIWRLHPKSTQFALQFFSQHPNNSSLHWYLSKKSIEFKVPGY
ncbi:MAG: hypothetical protein ABIJ34_00570 [archaeon]